MMKNDKIPPVLFVIFNRLDTTQQVFQIFKEVKPARLFIAADGPRIDKEGEAEKCDAVRKYVLDNIDWDCDVKTLFQEKNLGCGTGVATAISWFFEHVEAGIILEDDCLPHPDFFEYCYDLLEKYHDDENIAIISGDNFQDGKKWGDGSYYFTKYTNIWGWATWRRMWNKYQFDVNAYDKDLMNKKINERIKTKREQNFWKSLFENLATTRRTDVWDYQMNFCSWYNNMRSIVPNVNLIKNVGFGEDATHTLNMDAKESSIATKSILPLVHPTKDKIYDKAEAYFFNTYAWPSSSFSRFVGRIYKVVPSSLISTYRKVKHWIVSNK